MFIYFYNSLVLWGSSLFRKIRTPFTAPVLLCQEGESPGLWAPRPACAAGAISCPLGGHSGHTASAPACCSSVEDSAPSVPCFLILGKACLC